MPEWSVPPTACHIIDPPNFFNNPKQKDERMNNSTNLNGKTAWGDMISSVIHHDWHYLVSCKSIHMINNFNNLLTIMLEAYVLSQCMMGSEGAKQLPSVRG